MSFPNQPSAFRSWTRATNENIGAPSGYAAFRMRHGAAQPPRSRRLRPLAQANPLLQNSTLPHPSQDRLLLLANVALAMEARNASAYELAEPVEAE